MDLSAQAEFLSQSSESTHLHEMWRARLKHLLPPEDHLYPHFPPFSLFNHWNFIKYQTFVQGYLNCKCHICRCMSQDQGISLSQIESVHFDLKFRMSWKVGRARSIKTYKQNWENFILHNSTLNYYRIGQECISLRLLHTIGFTFDTITNCRSELKLRTQFQLTVMWKCTHLFISDTHFAIVLGLKCIYSVQCPPWTAIFHWQYRFAKRFPLSRGRPIHLCIEQAAHSGEQKFLYMYINQRKDDMEANNDLLQWIATVVYQEIHVTMYGHWR